MLRFPTPIQSAAILCGALICLASAHAMVPALKPLPFQTDRQTLFEKGWIMGNRMAAATRSGWLQPAERG